MIDPEGPSSEHVVLELRRIAAAGFTTTRFVMAVDEGGFQLQRDGMCAPIRARYISGFIDLQLIVDTLNADLAARNVVDRIQILGGGQQFSIAFGPPAAFERLAADGLLPSPQRITDEFYEKVLGITKDALRAMDATPSK